MKKGINESRKQMNAVEKVLDFIGKWFIIVIGITAGLGTFGDMFDISLRMWIIVFVTIISTGFFLMVSKRKHKRLITIITLLVLALVIVLLRKSLVNGIYSVANYVITVYNEYFGGEAMGYFDIWKIGADSDKILKYNMILFCTVAVIYSYILVTATWYKLFASVHILLSMVFLIPGLIFGKMPNSFYMTMLVLYYLICFMFQHNRIIYIGRMLATILVGVSIVGLIFLFNRPSEYDAEKNYQKYSERINELTKKLGLEEFTIEGMKGLLETEDVASGGINKGKLGEFNKIEYSGDIMLKLKMEKDSNNLYLKGFVANEYTGDAWKDMTNEQAALYQSYKTRVMQNSNELFDYNLGQYRYPLYIYYEKQVEEFQYLPYFSDASSFKKEELYYDLYLRHGKNSSYDYRYESLSEEEYYQYYSKNDDEKRKEELYYATSCDVGDLRDLFDKILEEPVYYDSTPEGLARCVNYVRQYLQENTSYTLSPGKLKSGDDYVTDFLTVKKKGYCTAYASAAVMMFRYLGIPARYVEGYVVTPSDTKKLTEAENGYVDVEVSDYSAHAWAEIYVPGFGFVPIEVTPGYFSSSSGENENPTTTAKQQENTTGKKVETTTENDVETTTKKKSDAKETTIQTTKHMTSKKEQEQSSKQGKTGYVVAILVIVALLCGISVLLYQKSERKKLLLNYKTEDFRHNILVLSVIFYQCLDKLHIEHSKNISLPALSEEINKRIKMAVELKNKNSGREEPKVSSELNSEQEASKVSDEQNLARRSKISGLPVEAETLSVLEIFTKAKYCDENVKFTAEECDKVRQYVEEFKNSLQYLKNRV